MRAAVIGAGRIADQHLGFLQSFPRAHLVGVCDRTPVLADFAAERFEADAAFTDHARMLAKTSPDVVHVLTPPHTHIQLVTDALECGADVIAEKPVAPTRAAFEGLWRLAEERGRRLTEVQNYRFNRPVREIERLLREGHLGDVAEVEVRMALNLASGRYADANLPHPSHGLPAGVIHEFITHLTYLTLQFTGGFDDVDAHWNNYGGGDLFRFDDLDALVTHGPLRARIRFTARTQPDCFQVTVRGTRGEAVAELFQPHVRVTVPRGGGPLGPLVNLWKSGKALKSAAVRGFRDKVMQRTPYEGLHYFLGRTYDAIRASEPLPVGHAEIDGTLALIDALLEGVDVE